MRILTAAAAATAAVVLLTGPALAHAELVPWQLPPGATAGLTLLVTHGCGDEDEWISSEPLEEQPTTAITVQAPLELELEPRAVAGWTLRTERDGTGRVVNARWDSVDPAGTSATLQIPIDVTVADLPQGTEVWVPVVQECSGGGSRSWTLEGDLRGGDEVPAMRLFVAEDAAAPPPHADGPRGSRLGRVGPSALALAIGIAGMVHLARRRARARADRSTS